MKKGCFRQRGIASREHLAAMAHNGGLEEADLIYGDSTRGRWVRADSLPELFSHKTPSKPAITPVQPKPPAPPPPPPPRHHPEKPRSISFKTYLTVLLLALLAILTLAVTGVLKKAKPVPPPPPVIPEETNIWQSVETDAADLIQSGQLKEAEKLINSYIEDCGTNEISARLTAKLNHRFKQEQLKELYSIFRKNQASSDQMLALVALSTELGETANLVTTLESALAARTPPSTATCKSILTLGRILKNHELQVTAVNTMGLNFKNSSLADCMKIVELYKEYQMPDKAVSLLQKFTEAHSDASEAWLELSALHSLRNNEDESLSALKKAVQTGGEPVREKARKDPRFDTVRDTWTFKWQTR